MAVSVDGGQFLCNKMVHQDLQAVLHPKLQCIGTSINDPIKDSFCSPLLAFYTATWNYF